MSSWFFAPLIAMGELHLILLHLWIFTVLQLVDSPTHQCGGVLDLVLTDVPAFVNVIVQAHVDNLDHAHLAITLSRSKPFLRSIL